VATSWQFDQWRVANGINDAGSCLYFVHD
jgi:hypothetical protein